MSIEAQSTRDNAEGQFDHSAMDDFGAPEVTGDKTPEQEPDGDTGDDAEQLSEEEVVAEATKRGWKTEDKWNGKKDGWETAEDFVKRTDNDLTNERMKVKERDERIQKLEDADKERDKTIQKMMAMSERAESSLRKQYEAKLEEIESQKEIAVFDADTDRYRELVKQEKKINESAQFDSPKKPEGKMDHAVLNEWVSKNTWYTTDDEMRASADNTGARIRNENPYMSDANLLTAVEYKMKEYYPQKFQTKQKTSKQSIPSSDTRAAGKSGVSLKKTFSNLPKDAQAQAKKWDDRDFMSIDEYVKGYDW